MDEKSFERVFLHPFFWYRNSRRGKPMADESGRKKRKKSAQKSLKIVLKS